VEGDVFVVWGPQTSEVLPDGRLKIVLPFGSPKVTGTYPAGSPVSYRTWAGAETIKINLIGTFGSQQYVEVESDLKEINETPKPKVLLEESIDNGTTWKAVEGFSETAEVVGGEPLLTKVNLKEKQFGPLLRIGVKSAAKGGAAGTFTILTQSGAALRA
jgi:hypothetical protein